jgi:hypothetical protein
MYKCLYNYKLVFLLLFPMLVISCSPTLFEMAVDVRRSAVFPINLEEKSITIYMTPYEEENTTVNDSLLKTAFASGVAMGLETELNLSNEAVYIYNHYPPENLAVDMEYIQSLARLADSDIVILIDSIYVSDFTRLENIVMGQNQEVQYLYASFNSKVSVYDGITAEVVAKVDQKDTVYWEVLTKSDLNTASSKEGVEKIVNMVAPRVGRDIAGRFFPSWVTEHRRLFVYGNPMWVKAYNYAQVFEWDKAIGIWLPEVDNKNGYRAACAAINIAVGCEMRGDPELALEWLLTAESLYDPQKLGLNSYKQRLRQEI